jgi:hypothetical protein
MIRAGILFLIVSFVLVSCSTQNADDDQMEITGIIQKQGITTYQYGTHTISGFALRSRTVDLDSYIDKKVTVMGHKIEGYPVDGGPEFIEVDKVE